VLQENSGFGNEGPYFNLKMKKTPKIGSKLIIYKDQKFKIKSQILQKSCTWKREKNFEY